MTEIEQKAKGLDSTRVQILLAISTFLGPPDLVQSEHGVLTCSWKRLSVMIMQCSSLLFVNAVDKLLRIVFDESDRPHDVYWRLDKIPYVQELRLRHERNV